ncbi:MAG: hypothetical protein DMG36_25745 [Acidobacteria bacterium]|nr:MAG: hypothetical protein DMG36_25745 [Acidobacteriota bacterium]
MLGQSSCDLPALTTDQTAKPPGPYRDLFRPKYLEPPNRLVMFTNVSVEVIVFTLTLLSILVLNQQPTAILADFH